MQKLNKPKPDITIYKTGQIDIYSKASERMNLKKGTRVSFFIDFENNLFIRVDEEGIKPSSLHGRKMMRYHSAQIARIILSLPDVPEGLDKAKFRIGEPDDGVSFPVITRRVL